MLYDIATAIALVLVIEGILPFLNPEGMRRAMVMLAGMDDSTLRFAGLTSMVLGLFILYLVR